MVHTADSSATRLAVLVTTPFPAHRPIAGAQVSLYRDTVAAHATTPLGTAVTDASGHAQLAAVGAGRYGLRARAPTAREFFTVVGLRGGNSDSLEVRLVRQDEICY
ncbi:MAG TPA: carboxypeptidase regulatory-like domain-containing protein [Gemmatimonadaceae bacterium]|nr:carboxypeptidase regulatory-like domain-containing protein [Gemmatimonadaceae bacterium]